MENSYIYAPNLEDYQCFVVRDSNTLRAYEEIPRQNSTISYRDYYINSHYLYQDGVQTFSQYASLPICLDNELMTNAYGYRNDISDIVVVSFFLIFTCYFLVSSCIKCLFKGRKLF